MGIWRILRVFHSADSSTSIHILCPFPAVSFSVTRCDHVDVLFVCTTCTDPVFIDCVLPSRSPRDLMNATVPFFLSLCVLKLDEMGCSLSSRWGAVTQTVVVAAAPSSSSSFALRILTILPLISEPLNFISSPFIQSSLSVIASGLLCCNFT